MTGWGWSDDRVAREARIASITRLNDNPFSAEPLYLDKAASANGVQRKPFEDDDTLRARLQKLVAP